MGELLLQLESVERQAQVEAEIRQVLRTKVLDEVELVQELALPPSEVQSALGKMVVNGVITPRPELSGISLAYSLLRKRHQRIIS